MWVIQSDLRAAGGVTGAATLDPGVSPALRSLSGHVFCESHRAVSLGPQVQGLVVTILLLLSHLSSAFPPRRHRGCHADTDTTALPRRVAGVAVMGVGMNCAGETS